MDTIHTLLICVSEMSKFNWFNLHIQQEHVCMQSLKTILKLGQRSVNVRVLNAEYKNMHICEFTQTFSESGHLDTHCRGECLRNFTAIEHPYCEFLCLLSLSVKVYLFLQRTPWMCFKADHPLVYFTYTVYTVYRHSKIYVLDDTCIYIQHIHICQY